MEVHAHTHTARKKWTHYLWEFLMLFLAVFCGFLAENQREHYVEHQREKQYMSTMLEDLVADTSLLNKTIADWAYVNKSIDSVTSAIAFPVTHMDLAKVYRHMNVALNYWSFLYNDRTMAQLKNSGGFRLVRNKKVANKLIAFDQFNNDAIRNIALQHNKFYENATALRSQTFVEDIISEINTKYGLTPPPYSANPWVDSLIEVHRSPLSMEIQTSGMFAFKNSIIALKRDYDNNMYWGYMELKKLINDLIQVIKEDYHLK